MPSPTRPSPDLFPALLVRAARLVPVGGVAAPAGPVDLRVRDGVVVEVGPGLRPGPDDRVHEAEGRWAIPGLWDHHVHLAQWADTLDRVDLAGTTGPEQVLDRLRGLLGGPAGADGAGPEDALVVGFGHRSATWSRPGTVAELDAVTGHRPVVLVSGDGHNGWLNSAAIALLGAPATAGMLTENDWFPVWARLGEVTAARAGRAAAYARAVAAANARGIVGVGDMEFGDGLRDWPRRFADGMRDLRVRVAVYPEGLDAALAAGLRSGDDLCDSYGLVAMGPLKIISDGSINTASAWCHDRYASPVHAEKPYGWPNFTATELTELLTRATGGGLTVAVHAIGDAAVERALDAFATSGARGGIEHAQLVTDADVVRMARLGVSASVQPAHLLDDRDVTEASWPGRAGRCFALRRMLDAGVQLRLGSDAPVSPLDPWLAMAAAVHRSADDRPAWVPEQAITPAEALAASTDGQTTLGPGSRGDLVLLDADPLAPADPPAQAEQAEQAEQAAAHLRGMPVAATFLGGRRVA